MSIKIEFQVLDKEKLESKVINEFSSLKKVIAKDNWLTGSDTKKAILLGEFLKDKNAGKFVKVKLHDDEHENYNLDTDFKIDDGTKKVFIAILDQKWETFNNVYKAYKTLLSIQDFEGNSSIEDFDENMVKQTILYFYNKDGYYAAKLSTKILTEYESYFSTNEIWRKFYTNSEFVKVIGENKDHKEYVTEKELYDLYDYMPNKQMYIIPILLFNGVRFSRVEGVDEISHLEINDLHEEYLDIRSGKNPRKISIDRELYNRIKEAALQGFVEVRRFDKTLLTTLNSSKYLLRSIKRKDQTEDRPMPAQSFVTRVNSTAEQVELEYGISGIRSKGYIISGKKHFIDKYLDEGHSLSDAIRMTLKRFGEWDYLEDESKENMHMLNIQRFTRTKAIWKSLSGK